MVYIIIFDIHIFHLLTTIVGKFYKNLKSVKAWNFALESVELSHCVLKLF